MLRIGHSPGKGRGVFAAKDFKKGEIIECTPLILIPPEQVRFVKHTILSHYIFALGARQCAIVLGYGSLYNHSYQPNAVYTYLVEEQCFEFEALMDITSGQEITVNYHGDPDGKDLVWFDVVE